MANDRKIYSFHIIEYGLFQALGPLQHPRDPDENHRTNECDDNHVDDPPSLPNVEYSKNPTSDNAASENVRTISKLRDSAYFWIAVDWFSGEYC